MSLIDDMMADAQIEPTNAELMAISKLAQDQLDWDKKIAQLETDLAAAQDARKQICEFLLPEAMGAVGMTEFKMLNGAKITIKDDVYASIRKDFVNEAVKWLDDNGLGGIVKDSISVDFGRGELESTQLLLGFCEQNGLAASEKLSVHPSTLKATVKEQLANGKEFPESYFSIAPVRKATIKLK